jgi:hypothetical protein
MKLIHSLELLLSVAIVSLVGAIYPDDHWSYSTKLTLDNYEDAIQTEISAGKTVFVRWIASEG